VDGTDVFYDDCRFMWDTVASDHTHRCIEQNTHQDEHICDCGERIETGHEVD